MSKPKRRPLGVRGNSRDRQATVVDNEDFTELMQTFGVEPRNRQQRRAMERRDRRKRDPA